MENTEKIIDICGDFITNYKYIFNKLDFKELQELKTKCLNDFNMMKVEFAKLMMEPNPGELLEEVEQKHRKTYYENHFALEELFKKDTENYDKLKEKHDKLLKSYELLVKEPSVIYKECSENCVQKYKKESSLVMDLAKKYEKALEQIQELTKVQKVSSVVDEFGDKRIYLVEYWGNGKLGNPSEIRLRIDSEIVEIFNKHKVTDVYLIVDEFRVYRTHSSPHDNETVTHNVTYKPFTRDTLISKYPFLKERFDQIFHSYIQYDEIKLYIHDTTTSELGGEIKLSIGFINRYMNGSGGYDHNVAITRFYDH